ncbi:MAG TPA: hypothetical protein DDW54_00945 [Clostridiales bacterium]|nr:hypothetical protein [Clostridiales bacterium]
MLERKEIYSAFKNSDRPFAHIEYFLEEKETEILYAEKDGLLLVYGGIPVIFGTKDGETAERILKILKDPVILTCSSEEEICAAKRLFPYMNRVKRVRQVRYGDVKKPTDGYTAEKLAPTKENIDFVFSTYSARYPREKIASLMRRFGFFAVRIDGKIAGYIGRHDEGSIGILEVMPEYRNRKIGSFLVYTAAEELKKEGKIAYAQIVESNEKSLNMHLKIGVVPSEKFIFWLEK